MSLDISHSTKNVKQYTKRYGTAEMWNYALEDAIPYYHINGLGEPFLPAILNTDPENISYLQWGFIPVQFAPKIKGKPIRTLKARNDRMFTEQSVFRRSAQTQRCLIPVDGFFENFFIGKDAFPHYVQLKTKEPFMVGGLWQTFTDPTDEVKTDTLALVTTPANKEIAWLHKEEPYTPESRMLFIVDKKDDETWLHGTPEEAQAILKPFPDDLLEYYPCQPLKTVKLQHRMYLGNVPALLEPKRYKELEK